MLQFNITLISHQKFKTESAEMYYICAYKIFIIPEPIRFPKTPNIICALLFSFLLPLFSCQLYTLKSIKTFDAFLAQSSSQKPKTAIIYIRGVLIGVSRGVREGKEAFEGTEEKVESCVCESYILSAVQGYN